MYPENSNERGQEERQVEVTRSRLKTWLRWRWVVGPVGPAMIDVDDLKKSHGWHMTYDGIGEILMDDTGWYWRILILNDDGWWWWWRCFWFVVKSTTHVGRWKVKYCLMNLWTVNLPIFSNHFTYFATMFQGCLDVYHHTARICGRFSAGMFRLQVSANTSTIGTSYWANGDPCHRGFCSNVWKTIYIITYYNPHPWKTYQRTQRTIKNNSGGGRSYN